MKLSVDHRNPTTSRTLEHLRDYYKKFTDDGGDMKKARNYCNVIQKAFFQIPIDQVKDLF